MSTAHTGRELWPAFWGELMERLDSIDLGSRSATKFDGLTKWLASEWNLALGDVVCKYVQHPKNRWNRLREASRRAPAAILLLFEGEEHGDVASKVTETAVVCPSLELVVVLTRPVGSDWTLGAVLYRESTALPEPLLSRAGATAAPIPFSVDTTERSTEPLPAAPTDASAKLVAALQALGTTGDDPTSPNRTVVGEALTALTGQPLERFAFKTIPSSKNLGNRLGEALARAPAVLVVICPEMLGERVLEEAERWTTSDPVPLVLVLCGEQIRVQVMGPDNEVVLRLRHALKESTKEPPSSAEAESLLERPSADVLDWRTWSYEEWNDCLFHYCLGAASPDPPPVERLAATPEELVVVVGATKDEIDDVARAFVDACLSKIPSGRSFYGYCGSDLGRRRASEAPWTPEADEPPYFFAMLWFTCLVAYGYPNTEGPAGGAGPAALQHRGSDRDQETPGRRAPQPEGAHDRDHQGGQGDQAQGAARPTNRRCCRSARRRCPTTTRGCGCRCLTATGPSSRWTAARPRNCTLPGTRTRRPTRCSAAR